MARPLHLSHWVLAALLLSACTRFSPASRVWEEAETGVAATCEDPSSDRCIVLACDEGECGIFDCEDVELEVVAHAPLLHGAELARGHRPLFRSPGLHRNWRRMGLRDDARPRMTFHFRYRQGYLPAFPQLEGKLVKHHLFPQAKEFKRAFLRSGINTHDYTMVIPEHLHLRIHRGASGGLWNEAWRQFLNANQHRLVPREEMLRKAFELALRFDIAGPLMPYRRPIPPRGAAASGALTAA